MAKNRCVFGMDHNLFTLPAPRSALRQNPTVVHIAHSVTGWLISRILKEGALAEHVVERRLVRGNGQGAVPKEKITTAMGHADVLLLGPCPRSMSGDTAEYAAEAHAVELAVEMRIWIALLLLDTDCATPPYLIAARSRVGVIATFGASSNVHDQLRRIYRLASYMDLNDVPANELKSTPPVHQKHLHEQHRPGNITNLARHLSRLVDKASS